MNADSCLGKRLADAHHALTLLLALPSRASTTPEVYALTLMPTYLDGLTDSLLALWSCTTLAKAISKCGV